MLVFDKCFHTALTDVVCHHTTSFIPQILPVSVIGFAGPSGPLAKIGKSSQFEMQPYLDVFLAGFGVFRASENRSNVLDWATYFFINFVISLIFLLATSWYWVYLVWADAKCRGNGKCRRFVTLTQPKGNWPTLKCFYPWNVVGTVAHPKLGKVLSQHPPRHHVLSGSDVLFGESHETDASKPDCLKKD